jgi:hypothetical protein
MVVVVMMRRDDHDHVMVVMMMMVMVVRDHGRHRTPHNPSSPDDGVRRVMNHPVRRDPRHEAVRMDHRDHVMMMMVMVVVVVRRHHHDDVMVVVMMMQIRRRRPVILRLDQATAARFLRVGEP